MSTALPVRPYAATELPDLRRRLHRALSSDTGKAMVLTLNQESHEQAEEQVRVFTQLDLQTMRTGELFHVAPGMVELANYAGRSLGSFGFLDHDLPSPAGVAYFDADLLRHDDHVGDFSERLLVTWQHVPVFSKDFPQGCVRLVFYVDRVNYMNVMMHRWEQAPHAEMQQLLPDFVYDGAMWLRYDHEAANVDSGFWHSLVGSDPAVRKARADLFRALCYLLGQRVTREDDAELPRAERRRAQREGKEPPRVRMISLRSSHGGGRGQGSREYVHQWMVRGHWRKQWYPSIQANRPVFIAPYVKGPEGAPLLTGDKVYRVKD